MNGIPKPPPAFEGKQGEVPEVDAADLKIVWSMSHESPALHSHGAATGGGAVFGRVCKPGADIEALGYRVRMLSLLTHAAKDESSQLHSAFAYTKEGELNDAVFSAAAKIPMKWIKMGIVTQGFPFDVEEFLRLCRSG